MRDYQDPRKDPYECIAKILYDPEQVLRINRMSHTHEEICKTNIQHSYLFSMKEANSKDDNRNNSGNSEIRRNLNMNRVRFSEGRHLTSLTENSESHFKPDLMQTIGVNKAILEFERLPPCWQAEILKCNPEMDAS